MKKVQKETKSLLDTMVDNKTTKKVLLKLAKDLALEVVPKIKNLEKLKNGIERGMYNAQIVNDIKNYKNIVGVYKRGKKAGKTKNINANFNKQELLEIIKQSKTIIRKDIYTKKGRKAKEESASKAFAEFKNSPGREDYTRGDFDNLTYLYNVIGKDLTSIYGSENVMDIYEVAKDNDVDLQAHDVLSIMEKYKGLGLDQEDFINAVYNDILDIIEGNTDYD